MMTRRQRERPRNQPTWLVLALALAACDSATLNLVSRPTNTAGQTAVDAGKADAAADSGTHAHCGNRPCACDDATDNDTDGLVDGLDPECSGAFDDDESSCATGSTVDAKTCRDCFWDSNSGAGNDSCRYPAACLRGENPASGGNCGSCEVDASCIGPCAPRTPNGCDCFGCCEVIRADGSKVTIEVSSSCSLRQLDDETACPRCSQNTACRNPCGRCELCPGRTSANLPADCAASSAPGAPVYRCDEGQPVCVTSSDCVSGTYCQLGCCLASLL